MLTGKLGLYDVLHAKRTFTRRAVRSFVLNEQAVRDRRRAVEQRAYECGAAARPGARAAGALRAVGHAGGALDAARPGARAA